MPHTRAHCYSHLSSKCGSHAFSYSRRLDANANIITDYTVANRSSFTELSMAC